MGVGTVIMVLVFTSLVTYDIADTTRLLELEPSHKNTLFNLWTRSKLPQGSMASLLLTFFSVGILLSGAASGAVAGSGMLRTLVKSKALPSYLVSQKAIPFTVQRMKTDLVAHAESANQCTDLVRVGDTECWMLQQSFDSLQGGR